MTSSESSEVNHTASTPVLQAQYKSWNKLSNKSEGEGTHGFGGMKKRRCNTSDHNRASVATKRILRDQESEKWRNKDIRKKKRYGDSQTDKNWGKSEILKYEESMKGKEIKDSISVIQKKLTICS